MPSIYGRPLYTEHGGRRVTTLNMRMELTPVTNANRARQVHASRRDLHLEPSCLYAREGRTRWRISAHRLVRCVTHTLLLGRVSRQKWIRKLAGVDAVNKTRRLCNLNAAARDSEEWAKGRAKKERGKR